VARSPGVQRRRPVLDVLGSVITALVVVGGVPAVLLILIGAPWSSTSGRHWSSDTQTLLVVLALVAWAAWAICCAQLTRAVIAQVRAGAPAVGSALTDRVAARIAVGILSLSALGTPAAMSQGAGATVITAVTAVSTPARATSAAAATPAPAAPTAAAPAAATYVVRPGDSLWSIAQAEWGDGADWTAIAALNLGRTMSDGLSFIDPSDIQVGWTMLLPLREDAYTPSPAPVPAPVSSSTPVSTPAAVPASTAPAAATASTPAAPLSRQRPTSTDTLSATEAHSVASVETPARHDNELPELLALGLGAIGCAALARRSRRLHLLRQLAEAEVGRPDVPSEDAMDADGLMARFKGAPVLDLFEAANIHLGRVLSDGHAAGALPHIRAVCAGRAGVDFWLRQAHPAPPGFTEHAEGTMWRLAHSVGSPTSGGRPYLPVVFPIGDDDEGTWLVPVGPGECLSLIGPSAADLWRAARSVQESWSWADEVVLSDQAALVVSELQLHGPADAWGDGLAMALFGAPSSLPEHLRHHVGVITTEATEASDLTIVVDDRAATLHPLGRSVRPHLLAPGPGAAVDELFDPPVPTLAPPDRPAAPAPLGEVVGWLPGPGMVDVRLLTATPRLDGLTGDLPANRARRAIELVAYLALHRPDAVTGDRLRTRVLGSSDADAARKTLFNTATAARRALGTDADGKALFPSGSRNGEYTVSDFVTVDVHRAATMAALGSAEEEPDIAMALLRESLEQIEGEPMANVLSGYTWWDAEGHGARLATVMVRAASRLAELAIQSGSYDLAWHGLDKARLVDPYSETLSQAAMKVAAAAGDADQLRREWRDCRRRMDELDPGAAPSPQTEQLYGSLARQVLAAS
jgi:DNA-binding SARP family transcriptional activator